MQDEQIAAMAPRNNCQMDILELIDDEGTDSRLEHCAADIKATRISPPKSVQLLHHVLSGDC